MPDTPSRRSSNPDSFLSMPTPRTSWPPAPGSPRHGGPARGRARCAARDPRQSRRPERV